jgi:hypothetical protein
MWWLITRRPVLWPVLFTAVTAICYAARDGRLNVTASVQKWIGFYAKSDGTITYSPASVQRLWSAYSCNISVHDRHSGQLPPGDITHHNTPPFLSGSALTPCLVFLPSLMPYSQDHSGLPFQMHTDPHIPVIISFRLSPPVQDHDFFRCVPEFIRLAFSIIFFKL